MLTDVMSGKSMDRPGLAELLKCARKGDTPAIVRLDRLDRSLDESLHRLSRDEAPRRRVTGIRVTACAKDVA